MNTAYSAHRTWLHAIAAGHKLLALAAISFALLPIDDWRILSLALIVPLALYVSIGKPALSRVALLRALWPMLTIIGLLQYFTLGWEAALVAIARLVLMVALADLVTMTTKMQDMMDAVMPIMRPLRYFGLRPETLALTVTLVIRFVPMLMEMWQMRAESYRARTGRRPSWRLIAPFIAQTLRLADHIAEAIIARGFDAPKLRRTNEENG